MSPVVLVCLVVSLVHHHGVQAVALLLPGHLLVYALDPCFTIRQVGLKARNPRLDLSALSQASAWTPASVWAQLPTASPPPPPPG